MSRTIVEYNGIRLEVHTTKSDIDGTHIIEGVFHKEEDIYNILNDEQFTDLEKLVEQKIKQEKVEALER